MKFAEKINHDAGMCICNSYLQ